MNRDKEADAANVLGNEAFERKRYDEALAYYDKAVSLAPTCPRYLSNRCLVHTHLGNLENAVRDGDRALEYSNLGEKQLFRVIMVAVGMGEPAAVSANAALLFRMYPETKLRQQVEEFLRDLPANTAGLPMKEPPRGPALQHCGQQMWFSFGSMVSSVPNPWWAAFSVDSESAAVEAHRFVADAFALLVLERKDRPCDEPHLFAFAMQLHRCGLLPVWFSLSRTLVAFSSTERLKSLRSREAIKDQWRSTPFNSPHIINVMRHLCELPAEIPVGTETFVKSLPDVGIAVNKPRAKPAKPIETRPMLFDMQEVAQPVIDEFVAWYALASDVDARAGIEVAIAIIRTCLPVVSRDELVDISAMLVLVPWRSAHHAVQWYDAVFERSDHFSWHALSAWVLTLAAHGWEPTSSNVAALSKFMLALLPPVTVEGKTVTVVAACKVFGAALENSLPDGRRGLDSVLQQVRVNPIEFHLNDTLMQEFS